MNKICYLLLLFVAVENGLHKKSDAQFDIFSFVSLFVRDKKRKKVNETFAKIYKELIKHIENIQQIK